jgi:cytochrome c-type protein NapB
MTMRTLWISAIVAVAVGSLVGSAGIVSGQTGASIGLPLRGPTPLDQIAPAPRMTPQRNTAERETRNYPEQPPVIPHSIEGYQLDLNGNKCLSCHARSRTGESQAPMISITHFMDRDGQFLATVSPRRFFCTQCHVPQHETKAPVENTFVDIDALLAREAPGGSRR